MSRLEPSSAETSAPHIMGSSIMCVARCCSIASRTVCGSNGPGRTTVPPVKSTGRHKVFRAVV
jgi:hypothetical protein